MLPLPNIRVLCFGRSWIIWNHKKAHLCPRCQQKAEGRMIFLQLPRHSPRGECPALANRPAPYAHPAARTLILRACHVDPLRYPVCQNPMRVIAVIDDPQVVEKILRRLGAWHDPRAVCHNARRGRDTGSHWSKPVAPQLHSTV
jgi:hypothetical protein